MKRVAQTIEVDELKTRADNLELLYEMESATIDIELGALYFLHAGRQDVGRYQPLAQRCIG